MTSAAGDLIDLDITGIAHGGTFIARHEGRVVFVSDAIPGERVRARVEPSENAEERRFWRADTVEVLDASPHRRPHVWREADVDRDPADRPGGADLGHIDLAEQRVLKKQVLGEALERFAGGGLLAPDVRGIDEGDGTGWRTRISLHVDDEGAIGPFAARSHRVVPVSHHPLGRPAVAAAASTLGKARPGRIELVEPSDGRVRIIPMPDGARRPAPEVVVEKVGGREFLVDANGFWQVHPQAATTLDAAVAELLRGRVDPDLTHFDLYGGVGLFSTTLAALGAEDIVTVESDRRATMHAEQNLSAHDVTAVTARVDRFLGATPAGTRAGVVVLDPPRAGAGKAVVEGILGLDPEAIVYVACDPVALARDLGTFRERGWDAEELRAFDLFPHSHHFETLALLRKV